MGYRVYHSQLSCLTPVSGELKIVTHMAVMQTNGGILHETTTGRKAEK